MTRLLTIDPGLTTGWAIGTYSTNEPYRLSQAWVTHDGADGVADVFWNYTEQDYYAADKVIIERFIVRPNQPVDPVALEVIGFIKGTVPLNAEKIWRLRSDKGKKGFMDAVLKKHGLWQTGKMVGHTDGRDANDAIIHALTWLCFKEKHQPTIERYLDVD